VEEHEGELSPSMLKNKPDIDKSFIEGEINKERKRRESGIGKGLDFM